MTQALSADNYVYQGVWTNWDRGSVLGLTLTLNLKQASILSPALAILISIAGAQLWRLIQYALHQFRVTPKTRPMIYHQMQVTLRNSSTDLNMLWQLVRIGIAWRQVFPLMILMTWTLLHFSLVVAFGLFSTNLIESNDQVLSRSPWCGGFDDTYWDTVYTKSNDPERTLLMTEYNEHLNAGFASVQQRVDICQKATGSCEVNPYRPGLNWTSNHIDACPFNSSICHPSAGTMLFDTGYMSSHSDLGFNAPKEDRVSLRFMGKCAPLDDAKHTSTWQNISTSGSGDVSMLAEASYGNSTHSTSNSTYSLWWKPLNCEQRLTTIPYNLLSFNGAPKGSTSPQTFSPIPEIQTSNADISLVILVYNDAYSGPVEDPWFSSQTSASDAADFCDSSNRTVYVRDRPLTAIGCTEQWQVCATDKNDVEQKQSSCSPLLGSRQLGNWIAYLPPSFPVNPRQYAIMRQIYLAGQKADFYNLVLALTESGSVPLKARSLLNSESPALSPALPPDQWQTETYYWMEMFSAYLQQAFLDRSTGQFAASTSYIDVYSSPKNRSDSAAMALYWLCQSQIIHTDTYRNFNLCALLITSIACVMIIVLGLSIEDCVGNCRRRRLRYSKPGDRVKQDMWEANSDLQMLRTIDEIKNRTSWTLSKNGVPRTHPGYEVDINSLTEEAHDIEEGKGIVLSAVKRTQSSQRDPGRNRQVQYGNPENDPYISWPLPDQPLKHTLYNDTVTYHHIEPYKEPPYSYTEKQIVDPTDTSDSLTFSNRIKTGQKRDGTRGPPSAEQWPWLNYLSLSGGQTNNNTRAAAEVDSGSGSDEGDTTPAPVNRSRYLRNDSRTHFIG